MKKDKSFSGLSFTWRGFERGQKYDISLSQGAIKRSQWPFKLGYFSPVGCLERNEQFSQKIKCFCEVFSQ